MLQITKRKIKEHLNTGKPVKFGTKKGLYELSTFDNVIIIKTDNKSIFTERVSSHLSRQLEIKVSVDRLVVLSKGSKFFKYNHRLYIKDDNMFYGIDNEMYKLNKDAFPIICCL